MNIKEQRAGSVRIIGDVALAMGQVPDDPRIDRAEQQFTLIGGLARSLDVVKNPFDLRTGKIRID